MIHVNGADLSSQQESISYELRAMEVQLEDLAERARLLSGNWDGEAQRAFALCLAQAHTQLARLIANAHERTCIVHDHIDAITAFDSRRARAWDL